jgi:2-isopropylmalate synthase
MRPEDVGVPRTTLVLGKHSGRHAVQARCEHFGLTLSRHDLDEVYRLLIARADARKHITDEDLLTIATEVCGVTTARTREASTPTTPVGAHPHDSGYGFGV